MTLTMVLGGARSGKSVYAEGLIGALPAPWVYVATARGGDEEMRVRISLHQERRGGDWVTREAPDKLDEALLADGVVNRPVLVDCLTLWVSNLMLTAQNINEAWDKLEDALARRGADTVLVSNEVGLGIVPDNALARQFRDEAGRVNQRLAKVADRVVFMVAGLPMIVK